VGNSIGGKVIGGSSIWDSRLGNLSGELVGEGNRKVKSGDKSMV